MDLFCINCQKVPWYQRFFFLTHSDERFSPLASEKTSGIQGSQKESSPQNLLAAVAMILAGKRQIPLMRPARKSKACTRHQKLLTDWYALGMFIGNSNSAMFDIRSGTVSAPNQKTGVSTSEAVDKSYHTSSTVAMNFHGKHSIPLIQKPNDARHISMRKHAGTSNHSNPCTSRLSTYLSREG